MSDAIQSDLRQLLGVSSQSHQQWMGDLALECFNLREATRTLMCRELREAGEALLTVIDEIHVNCRKDPDDIREEIALPSYVKRLAEVLEEQIDLAVQRNKNPTVRDSEQQAVAMLKEGQIKFKALLSRMLSNDGDDFTSRAKIVNSVFNRMPMTERRGPS